MLVLLNFSTALVAVPLAVLAARTVSERLVAAVAVALCAPVPFVVDPGDLDARWWNAVPALGVAIAFGLTLRELPRASRGWGRLTRGDRIRGAFVAALVLLSIPWLAAIVGLHFGAGIFLSGQHWSGPHHPAGAVVHLGWHHGLDGLLLMTSVVVLTRRPSRPLLALYFGLLFAYAAVNFANDIWLEQVVKRGWTSWEIPGALEPGVNWPTLTIILLGLVLWPVFRRGRPA